MSEETDFFDICRRIRFKLDEPADLPIHQQRLNAEFVARVRSAGLRVSVRTVPDVYRSVRRVQDALRLDVEPEAYVVNEPSANAFVPTVGADVFRPVIVLNSGLVTLLRRSELDFAIAHELGHLGFRHGPIHECANSEFEALKARSAQWFAEISADRLGLIATRSLYTAAHVMVKLASGLPTEALGFDIESFVRQMEVDPDELSRAWELDETHPSLPFRLWALMRFSHTTMYLQLAQQGVGGLALSLVESEIAERFGQIGDGRLSEMEAEIYQLALVWVCTAMILDGDTTMKNGRAALVQLVGETVACKAIHFAQTNGPNAVHKKLEEAIARIDKASSETKEQFSSVVLSFSLALGLAIGDTHAGRYLQRRFGFCASD